MFERTTRLRKLGTLGFLVIVFLLLSSISITGTLIGLAGILVLVALALVLSRNRRAAALMEEIERPKVHRDASAWLWSRIVVIVSAVLSILVWAFAIGYRIDHAEYLISPAIVGAVIALAAAVGAARPWIIRGARLPYIFMVSVAVTVATPPLAAWAIFANVADIGVNYGVQLAPLWTVTGLVVLKWPRTRGPADERCAS